MSVYWNRRTAALSPYIPGEQPRDRNIIKLNTNENPYPPSPRVVEAIERALSSASRSGNLRSGGTRHASRSSDSTCSGGSSGLVRGESLRLYPDPLCTEFREAAASLWGLKPEQIFPGNGSDEVLAFAFGAFFESAGDAIPGNAVSESAGAGDVVQSAVLFPDITYSFYPVYAGLWNIPYKTIPLKEDFSINLDDYAVPESSGGVIIPNPNAPTGRALPAADLLRLARQLEERRRILIVDEAYIAFGAESLTARVNEHPNLLVIHTLSKSASLAGLRAGFAAGSKELIDGLFRVRDSFNSYTMDALAIAAASAALRDKAYYDNINRTVSADREQTAAALASLGFTVIPSSANFLFVSGAPGISGSALFQALRDRGILVRHFDKPRIADYVRVSIGTGTEMDRFLDACKAIAGTYP